MREFIQALAVSDTHGNHSALDEIARSFSKVKYVFHLGDYTRDAEYLSDHMRNSSVINVKGNCDVASKGPSLEELIIKGNRILLTHGHLQQVKYGYERILYLAQEKDAKAVLFGHTHIPYIENVGGIWLINPGSAGEPRGGRPTVAMLLIGDVGIIPKLLYLS